MLKKITSYIYANKEKGDLQSLNAQIVSYGIFAAVLIEIVSLPFLGADGRFLYGLAFGAVVTVINHRILSVFTELALYRRLGAALLVAGYMIRLGVYGSAFLYAYRLGTKSAIAFLLGILAMKFGILFVYGIRPGFRSRKRQNKEE